MSADSSHLLLSVSGPQCHEDVNAISLRCETTFEKHVADHSDKSGADHMTASMPTAEQPKATKVLCKFHLLRSSYYNGRLPSFASLMKTFHPDSPHIVTFLCGVLAVCAYTFNQVPGYGFLNTRFRRAAGCVVHSGFLNMLQKILCLGRGCHMGWWLPHRPSLLFPSTGW